VDVTGTLALGGLCGATDPSWAGKVVLCERGTNSFADKVTQVRTSGGTAAVIYNNVSGAFAGTLNGTSTIPGLAISREDGLAALAFAGQSATVVNTSGTGDGYESYDGTSMATPHVSGAAALVWSLNPTKTAAQIRDAFQKTAIDKGTAGRDTSFGFGIIQAKAAHDYLQQVTPPPTTPTITSITKVTTANRVFARLVWTGATGTSVDYYRGTRKYSTTNDGTHDDGPLRAGTYTYKVCLTGTTTCSPTVSFTN
jgi:hypothetical protein